ncbi:MAG: response regulator transcription factor [Chloroflexi bacterium]|nr:response regulator transcription factor [Chloroflexota bacterium]
MDGITATREIKQKLPDVSILVLTLYAEDFMKEAIEAGVSGYLLKDSDCDLIVKAVHEGKNGFTPIAPALTRGLVDEYIKLSKHNPSQLSKRQTEILKLIADGVSSKNIENQLFISSSTVKREIRNIFDKLGVYERAHAVSEAIKRKII